MPTFPFILLDLWLTVSQMGNKRQTRCYRTDRESQLVKRPIEAEYNNLRCLGSPYAFRVNKAHEFILIFQKPKV